MSDVWLYHGKRIEELDEAEAKEALTELLDFRAPLATDRERRMEAENERLKTENTRLWRALGGIE